MSASKASLGEKAGIVAVGRVIAVATRLISFVVLARLLSKEQNGILTLVWGGYIGVTAIAQLGMPESVFYFFERISRYLQRDFIRLLARVLIVLGLGGGAILVALNYVPLWAVDVRNYFLLLIPVVLLELPTMPLPNALIAVDKEKASAIFNIIVAIMQFAAIVLPAILLRSIPAILYALILYAILRAVLSLLFVIKYFPDGTEKLGQGKWREVLLYSIPLSIAQIMWSLNLEIDKFVVADVLPADVVADYGFGAREIPFIPIIAYSVGAVIMPRLVAHHLSGSKGEMRRLWVTAIERTSVILLPLVILFEIIAEEYITLMFGERYLGAVIPFRIYTLILLQRVVAYSSVLKAANRNAEITRSAVLLLGVNFAFSIPLVRLLGTAGPPIGTIIANICSWTYVMSKIKDELGVPFSRAFPFAFYFKVLMAALLAGLPVFFIFQWLDFSLVVSMITKILAFGIMYVVIGQVMGVLKISDILRYFARD